MPPSGTTGKSSSKTGARGPTGPKGEARTSPAGSGGGKPGSVSRTSSGARGPTGPKGQARTSPAGGKAGSTSRAPTREKSSFERFQERYPGGLRSMPVVSIPPPTPGGFGPAGSAISGAVTRVRDVAGRLLGAERRAAEALKQREAIERMAPMLERMKQSEAIRLGKPSIPGKLPDTMPPPSFRQMAEASKPVRGASTWRAINRRINDVTDSFGYGTGKMARAKTAATIGGLQESSRAAAERALFGDQKSMYKNGGLVTKKGRVPPKGCK